MSSPVRWLTAFLDLTAANRSTAQTFWCEVTGTHPSRSRGPGGAFATLLPTSGDAYLRLQEVLDGPGGVHLDVHVDRAHVEAVADRAIALGALQQSVGPGLIVLSSPGGLAFCVTMGDGESRVPAPARDPLGRADRLDQVCLDIPPAGFDAERDFWAELTGWPAQAGSRPEFAFLSRPDGIPLRLLLQRREVAEPGEPVTAHVDFACDDRVALAERHVAAGAGVLARRPGWITLADPTGRAYCLTSREPALPGRPPPVTH